MQGLEILVLLRKVVIFVEYYDYGQRVFKVGMFGKHFPFLSFLAEILKNSLYRLISVVIYDSGGMG